MTEDATRNGLEVWALFLRVHARVVQRLEAEMEAEEGLPLSWFYVLIQLSFAPEQRMRMHDLLPSLMLTRSGLTRRIDRMERAGLVGRTGCPGDARGVVVVLTASGQARLRAVAPAHAARIHTYFARHLSEEERAVLVSAFRAMLDTLETAT